MHVSNCATIRRSISRWAVSRLGVIASISSMNNRHGAWVYSMLSATPFHATLFPLRTLASSKTSLIFFSDSPDMPETMDGAEMLMKGTFNS